MQDANLEKKSSCLHAPYSVGLCNYGNTYNVPSEVCTFSNIGFELSLFSCLCSCTAITPASSNMTELSEDVMDRFRSRATGLPIHQCGTSMSAGCVLLWSGERFWHWSLWFILKELGHQLQTVTGTMLQCCRQ